MDEVARSYRAMAGRYTELFGHPSRVHVDDLALIDRHLGSLDGPVIDLGCGPGHLAGHLAAGGVTTVGIDLVPEFVAHARASFPAHGYLQGSIRRLPLRSGSVDGVLAWYSLIHLEPGSLDGILCEIRRVTARGAPLVAGWFDGDAISAFDHAVTTAYHWPVDELSERLRRAGFDEVARSRRPADPAAGTRSHAALVAVAI